MYCASERRKKLFDVLVGGYVAALLPHANSAFFPLASHLCKSFVGSLKAVQGTSEFVPRRWCGESYWKVFTACGSLPNGWVGSLPNAR